MYFGSPKGQLSPNKHTPRNQQQLQKQNEAKIQAPQLPTDGKLAVYWNVLFLQTAGTTE